MKRRLVIILIGVLLVSAGLRSLWLRQAPDRAARLIAGRKLADAQKLLKSYLFWYPADSQARLLLAEAHGLDDDSSTSVSDALEQLSWIPNSAPEGADARFREGQLLFLIRHRPAAAERILRESLRLRPNSLPATLLLWKLLDVTGRQAEAAPFFWKAYELSDANEQPYRLREWYLSEFSPGSASLELDRRWGILGERELPTQASEFRRLEMFIRDEPDAPLGYALAALWSVRNRDLERASSLLADGVKLPEAWNEPQFVAATIALALEQGQFTAAEIALNRWPEPRAGYEFFKFQGTILDEVKRDIPAAVTAYRSAIQADTGDAEWTTQNRLAHCLRKSGDAAEAERIQKQAKIVEELMEPGVHRKIREGLVSFQDPRGLRPILELYQALGRKREVEAWKKVLSTLHETHAIHPTQGI